MRLTDAFPRRSYTHGPTPLEFLPRLSKHMGGPPVWIKRDDQLGLAGGGNKTRKLEFLMAQALADGADTVITLGGVQSNHCRLTLAAAIREGLECELILEEDPGADGSAVPGGVGANPPVHNGNFLLFDLMDASNITIVAHGSDLMGIAEQRAEHLRRNGKRPFLMPVGGSTAVGALGYVDAAEELLTQFDEAGIDPSALIVASGSGGMHAGLAAGLTALGSELPVVGINVSRDRASQESKVGALTDEVTSLLGSHPVAREQIVALDEWVGAGYTLPTEEMREAVRLFARTEAIVLDPVYTGKAAAGLIALIRRGHVRGDQPVVFLHSGGAPGLFARAETVRSSR